MKIAKIKIIARPWSMLDIVRERERIWENRDLPKEERRKLDDELMKKHAEGMAKEITEKVLTLKEEDTFTLEGKFLGSSFVKKGNYEGKIVKISNDSIYIEWGDNDVNKIGIGRAIQKSTKSFDAGTSWTILLESIEEG